MVAFLFKRWLMVRVAYDGSSVAVKGKMWSRNLSESSCTGGEAWEAMVWRGIGRGKDAKVVALCGILEGASGGYKLEE
jgi:hypothetical protein